MFPGEFMANTSERVPSIQAEGVVRAPFAMAALLKEGTPAGPTPRPVRSR